MAAPTKEERRLIEQVRNYELSKNFYKIENCFKFFCYLKKLRSRVEDILLTEVEKSDAFLIRWIRGFNF